MPRAVILTALPVEYLAVCAHLTDLREEMHPQGTIYERGKFVANRQTWEVGVAEIGAGNTGSAVEAERAIVHFKPDLLLFVGIAGGIKDVEIGDVVAATEVYGYESGKLGEHFSTRPKVGKSAHALVQRARAEARKEEWIQRLPNIPVSLPRVHIAPIAAGEKVVASKHSDVFRFLRMSYNDAVAVEMEGFGFLSAAFAYPEIKSIVIRGISDLIEGKNDDSIEMEQVRQRKASHHASAFAFEIVSKLAELRHPIDLSPESRDLLQTNLAVRPSLALEANPSKKEVAKYDFSQLQYFLSMGNWKEADQETARLLLNFVGKSLEDCLRVEDLQKISHLNLIKISKMWDGASNNKFGFNKQMKIWHDIGGTLNHETEQHLCNILGWRQPNGWKNYSELSFHLGRVPEGHLPGFFLSSWCWRGDLLWLSLLQKLIDQN